MIKVHLLRNLCKLFLASAAVFIAGSASAQEYWKENYPYSASQYQQWEGVSSNYLVSYSDMAVRCDKLTGLTDFADQPSRIDAWTTAETTIKSAGNELVIVPTSGSDYAVATCTFSTWDGAAPNYKSTNMADYNRSGIMVDMKPAKDGLKNAVITARYLFLSYLILIQYLIIQHILSEFM